MVGNARFLPSDPDGLFVKWALQLGGNPEWDIEFVIDFLCPLETTHKRRPIAGGLLAPEEETSGQLHRLISSVDSVSNINILHLFVAYGNFYNTNEIVDTFRMLRHVYGPMGLACAWAARFVITCCEVQMATHVCNCPINQNNSPSETDQNVSLTWSRTLSDAPSFNCWGLSINYCWRCIKHQSID